MATLAFDGHPIFQVSTERSITGDSRVLRTTRRFSFLRAQP